MNIWLIIHRIIAVLINAFLIGCMLYIVTINSNDKSPGIFFIFYLALIVLNLLIAIVLNFLKTKHFRIYRQILLAEFMLFIPLILIVANL